MKKVFLIGTATLTLLIQNAFPQASASSEIPSGPLVVAQMPDFARWSIDYTYSNAPKAGQPTTLDRYKQEAQQDPAVAKAMQDPQYVFTIQDIRPVHTLVTKTGDVTHEETTFEQDYKGETWSNNQIKVEKAPNQSDLNAVINTDFGSDVFPDLEWVSKANFVGFESHNGIRCMAFKQDRYNDQHQFIGTAHAYIDATTLYPVGFQLRFETREYTFLPPPTKKLVMPPECLAAGKAMIAQIQKATPHLAPP